MNPGELRAAIDSPDSPLRSLYGGPAEEQQSRYRRLLERVLEQFEVEELRVFSTPGRVELGGNHTDHNGGKVLAASVQVDSIAMVEPTGDSVVTLFSEGYANPFRVDLSSMAKNETEVGQTEALIRGVAARLKATGHRVGGFRGCMTSTVLPGSGLSSSASVEILFGTIFNHLFNDGAVGTIELSLAAQYAENEYFGKPCGLMDQIACATGGVVSIDFADPQQPVVQKVQTAFSDFGYALHVCNTGGSHADLTEDYAAVRREMRSVAEFFGKSLCRELSIEQVLGRVPELRRAVGDRAILRSLHFFLDNERVERQLAALRDSDFAAYLDAVRSAGDSSWELLQNNYSPADPREQGVPLALAMSRRFLGEAAAVRIQGGGFAGTMQAYVPLERSERYREFMEGVLGPGAVASIKIRSIGTTEVSSSILIG